MISLSIITTVSEARITANLAGVDETDYSASVATFLASYVPIVGVFVRGKIALILVQFSTAILHFTHVWIQNY